MNPVVPEQQIFSTERGLPGAARPASFEVIGRPGSLAPPRRLLQPLPGAAWGLLAVAGIWGAFSPNPALTLFAVALPAVFFMLLWRPAEPPALLYICGYQWLQATAAIFYANYHDTPLETAGGPDFVRATSLSLFGLLALAIGMRAALSRLPISTGPTAAQEASRLSIDRLLIAYLVSLVACSGLRGVAWVIPGISQALIAASNLKWVPLFLLLYAILVQQRRYGLAVLVIALEVFVGLLGFFGSFKAVLFLAVVVLLSSPRPLRSWRLVALTLVGAVFLALSVVWTVIKMDYRAALNQGSGQQEVLIPVEERVGTLGELVGDLSWDTLGEGIEALVLRVSYVTYFAAVLQNVPENVPYEDGALWLGTLEHIFKPRLFFPNKPRISDSERTIKYTGLMVAGEEQGTSISIGYMAESYIDFGPVSMFAPILLLGMLYGWIYRKAALTGRSKTLGFAVASTILVVGVNMIESSNIKIIGNIAINVIVMFLFVRLCGKPFMRFVRAR